MWLQLNYLHPNVFFEDQATYITTIWGGHNEKLCGIELRMAPKPSKSQPLGLPWGSRVHMPWSRKDIFRLRRSSLELVGAFWICACGEGKEVRGAGWVTRISPSGGRWPSCVFQLPVMHIQAHTLNRQPSRQGRGDWMQFYVLWF